MFSALIFQIRKEAKCDKLLVIKVRIPLINGTEVNKWFLFFFKKFQQNISISNYVKRKRLTIIKHERDKSTLYRYSLKKYISNLYFTCKNTNIRRKQEQTSNVDSNTMVITDFTWHFMIHETFGVLKKQNRCYIFSLWAWTNPSADLCSFYWFLDASWCRW